jgi:hypothetical protein
MQPIESALYSTSRMATRSTGVPPVTRVFTIAALSAIVVFFLLHPDSGGASSFFVDVDQWAWAFVVVCVATGFVRLRYIAQGEQPADGEAKPVARRSRSSAEFDLETLDQLILTRAILPAIRRILNAKIETTTSRIISPVRTRGLGNTSAEGRWITTATHGELERLLRILTGGAIAVVGRRGAGKTTLLETCCASRLGPRPRLAVRISAPVHYEPVDFLSHLLGQLCRNLTGIDPYNPTNLRHRQKYTLALVFPALVFAAIGLTLHSMSGPPKNWPHSIPAEVRKFVASHRWLHDRTHSSADGFLVFSAVFIVALLVNIVVRVHERQRLAQGAPLTQALIRDRGDREYVVEIAIAWQRRIQYSEQRWSMRQAGANMRGIQLVRSREHSLATRPLSQPELISGIERVASAMTTSGVHLRFAVDELDKLDNPDDVAHLVNTMKPLYALPKCHWLLAISDDALQSFSRNPFASGSGVLGLGDSAFDEIITVPALSFEESLSLIRQRVIGLPDAVVAVAHAISGGRARETVRIVRRMVMAQRSHGSQIDISYLVAGSTAIQETEWCKEVLIAARVVAASDLSGELISLLTECATGRPLGLVLSADHDSLRPLGRKIRDIVRWSRDAGDRLSTTALQSLPINVGPVSLEPPPLSGRRNNDVRVPNESINLLRHLLVRLQLLACIRRLFALEGAGHLANLSPQGFRDAVGSFGNVAALSAEESELAWHRLSEGRTILGWSARSAPRIDTF